LLIVLLFIELSLELFLSLFIESLFFIMLLLLLMELSMDFFESPPLLMHEPSDRANAPAATMASVERIIRLVIGNLLIRSADRFI